MKTDTAQRLNAKGHDRAMQRENLITGLSMCSGSIPDVYIDSRKGPYMLRIIVLTFSTGCATLYMLRV